MLTVNLVGCLNESLKWINVSLSIPCLGRGSLVLYSLSLSFRSTVYVCEALTLLRHIKEYHSDFRFDKYGAFVV